MNKSINHKGKTNENKRNEKKPRSLYRDVHDMDCPCRIFMVQFYMRYYRRSVYNTVRQCKPGHKNHRVDSADAKRVIYFLFLAQRR